MSEKRELQSAPGISIKALLSGASDTALRDLIGSSILDILAALDPNLSSTENLRSLASNILDPIEALRDPEVREKILGLLPLSKARELADRVGVHKDANIYENLSSSLNKKFRESDLFSFFGVVIEERAPMARQLPLQQVVPTYGLFDHQKHAAERVRDALTVHPNKVLLHMPTGSGKTRTAMHIISEHLHNRRPTVVVWLASSAELLEQAASEFANAWQQLGDRPIALARFWGKYDPDITSVNDGLIVAGLSKFYSFFQRHQSDTFRIADKTSLTIIDEAHQAIAPTYNSLINALYTRRKNSALLGLTATPGRSWDKIADDLELSNYFENSKVTLEVSGYDDPIKFLIDDGYLAKPSFSTIDSQCEISLTEKEISELEANSDIPETVLNALGDDQLRNLAVVRSAEQLVARHKRIIVFAASVRHARVMSAILRARGYEADLITGETDDATRERVINRYKSQSQKPHILCNFGVLTTGFDAPSTSAAVIARPTRSLVLYSQMVGRATRGIRAGGNKTAEILTVIDPKVPGFGSIADAFRNWEDVWHER